MYHLLILTCSFLSVILDDDSTSSVQGMGLVNATSIVLISESQTYKNISTLPSSDVTTNSGTIFDDNLLIALCKDKCTCTSHFISHFVSYSHLSPSFHSFISSMDSYYVPKSVSEALSIPR